MGQVGVSSRCPWGCNDSTVRSGGLAGRAGGFDILAMNRPLLLTVVTKQGDHRCGGAGAGDVRAGWRGMTGSGGVAAGGVVACPSSVLRRVNSSRADSPRLWGRLPLMASANLPAAAMTASSGVTVGAEMYLCLWKMVPDTQVARVSFIHMVQPQ